ncbi:MAG: hypothetical protein JWQ66_1483 [Mucilaginibacter sp.]|nr:hypothetical protein [Mucilaginibacter sp.]
MKPFISTSVYGFLNYVLAITLMSSPWLFGFSHVGGASFFLPLVFGWLQLIMAIFSKHRFGFMGVFPVSMHCFIDVVGGSFLMVSPFLYDYSSHVFWPQLVLGGLVFFMGIFTKTSPLTDEPQHVFRDGLMGSTSDVDEPMAH